MRKEFSQIRVMMIMIMLFSFSLVSAQSLFYTNFNNESNWDNPGGDWEAYNQKIYDEEDWEFTAESSIRDTENPIDGSAYSLINQGDLTIIANSSVEDMVGFRFLMRDRRENPKAARNIMYSTNGGIDWSFAMEIDADYFPDGDNHYPVDFDLPTDKQSFDAGDFQILVEGESDDNYKLGIGSFEVFGTPPTPWIDITLQPVNRVICEDEFATFTVEAESNFEISYQWFFIDEEIEDATDNFIEVNMLGEYYCMLTVEDLVVYTDVVSLTVSVPLIDWPETIEYCTGSTVVLDPGMFETYLWSDDSEESTLEVTESGEYSVTVTNEYSCIAIDTVNVEFVEEITINLGGVINACEGDEVIITAPVFGDHYIWSTGTTGQSITVTQPGIYSLTLTQGVCIVVDEVEVIFHELPEEFELGADIYACDGEEITLEGPVNAVEYLWNTGDDTQTIVVDETGTYTLHVFNHRGCYVSSDIYVEFNDFLVISLHDEDTIYACANYPVILDPIAMGGDVEWSWDVETSTDSILSATETGWYYVTVTRATCVGSDEVYIHFYGLPEIDLGPNLAFCDGFTDEITAPEGFDYLWNTGEITQQITVDTAGVYICTITDMYGCYNSDQLLVTVYSLPNVDLGPDLTIDEDQTIMLAVETGHFEYLWSTSETSDYIMIYADDYGLGEHVFSVTVTSTQDCIASDEITITVVEGLDVELLSADNISIYPNPASDKLFIQLTILDDISISITNITGQVINVISPTYTLVEVDIDEYAPGMYFVIINSGKQSFINKIIIE